MSDQSSQKELFDFPQDSSPNQKKVEEGEKPDVDVSEVDDDALLEEYLQEAERRYTEGGYNVVKRTLKKFQDFLDGKNVAEAKLENVREFLWAETEEGIREGTMKHRLSDLREMYRYFATYHPELNTPNLDGLSIKDFSTNLPEPIEREALTKEEMDKLINQPSNTRNRLIIAMLYYTGQRANELANTKVDDVNLEERIVHVRAENAKLGKSRKVPIPRKLVSLIRTWLERDRPSYLGSQDSSCFFISKASGGLCNREIAEIVKKNAEEAGIQEVLGEMSDGRKMHKVTPHALRHTFATHLLNRGMRPEHVKELLGHEKLKTTMRYAKVKEEKAFESYDEVFR
ncbi:hypothetical protein AKJ51_04640 [candidate division MSBL1 archaeon SCGC-AAA382A20]|uniref:Tyr recombinase domain-containing protein n=1 Tax=candidate division MSBL1 archaeon SCGC-AAA382A20 TaxID=1698280 RepID=A0A133VHD5_9EURY|nr:hypothetical protein AKJ51_04640 [candidate division MSBL1 archaeon SCGC-AAA382A20]